MVVLVDRVDEPTAVAGDAMKMRSLIWPMFDNKFLKQEGIGIKLLLPIELSYLLNKEGPAFFQEARLDKQNMIEKLSWSGATLYDLCSARLNACTSAASSDATTLTSLFEENVTRQTLIDALDQMHQPRDAFKFLYGVVQEHCRLLARARALPRPDAGLSHYGKTQVFEFPPAGRKPVWLWRPEGCVNF